MLNNTLLTILNIVRARSIKSTVITIEMLNIFIAILGLFTILEDENLAGLTSAVRTPPVLSSILFILLMVQAKQFVRLTYETTNPYIRKPDMRYGQIEDKIFMEEYESPE